LLKLNVSQRKRLPSSVRSGPRKQGVCEKHGFKLKAKKQARMGINYAAELSADRLIAFGIVVAGLIVRSG
jgi:hypothetical protein